MKLSEKFFVGALGGIIGAVITILITGTYDTNVQDKPADATFNTITCKSINVTQDNGTPAVSISGNDITGGEIFVFGKDPIGGTAIHLGSGTINCQTIYVLRSDGRPAIDITGKGDRKHGYIMMYGEDDNHGRVNIYAGWSDDLGDNKTFKNDAGLSVSGTIYYKDAHRTSER
jgi:hypothetical protein